MIPKLDVTAPSDSKSRRTSRRPHMCAATVVRRAEADAPNPCKHCAQKCAKNSIERDLENTRSHEPSGGWTRVWGTRQIFIGRHLASDCADNGVPELDSNE